MKINFNIYNVETESLPNNIYKTIVDNKLNLAEISSVIEYEEQMSKVAHGVANDLGQNLTIKNNDTNFIIVYKYKRFVKFNRDIYDKEDNNRLVWKKDKEYFITYEDLTHYYFGKTSSRYGIDKDSEGTLYTIINKERIDD